MNINQILKQELELIKPSEQDLKELESDSKKVINEIGNKIKKYKIKAKVFIGGSYAKNTLIKKNKYDIDVFVRFDKGYNEVDLRHLLKKIIPKKSKMLHGSRDYFYFKIKEISFEIIPCLEISKPEQARNVTDLSYFHVNYLKNQIKKQSGLCDEIRLAKAFTYYQECYGAESYINGFSGYAIELIVCYYKNFLKFVKAMAEFDLNKKLVVDPSKFFKDRDDVLKKVDSSKLLSPIVFIDPTYKERNALAALSYDTLNGFQKSCKKFLKNPSMKFFELKDKEAELKKKYGKKLLKLEISTDRQVGDIAGTKLKKFSNFMIKEIEKFFEVKAHEFIYDEEKNLGSLYFVVVPKKQIMIYGPPIKMKKRIEAFKKAHKKERIVVKKGRAVIVRKINPEIKGFVKDFKKAKKKTIKEMDVEKLVLS